MHRAGPARLPGLRLAKAWLLLAVFLTAGTSLPSLDAVVYHRGGADLQRWESHVEPAGGCFSHEEHCTLGRTAPGSGSVVHLSSESRTEPLVRPVRWQVPASPHIRSDRSALPQTRAPPAPLA